jgi:hypothetical protein
VKAYVGIEVSAAVGGSEVRHHAHHPAGIANAAGDPAKAPEKLRFRISGFLSGYRFSDTASPSKSIAPLGAGYRMPILAAVLFSRAASAAV